MKDIPWKKISHFEEPEQSLSWWNRQSLSLKKVDNDFFGKLGSEKTKEYIDILQKLANV